MTYERIVEVDEEDVTDDKIPRSSPLKALPDTPPIHDVTEEELKYCFRRIILMASAPPISELEIMLLFNDEATCLIRRDCDQAFIPISDHKCVYLSRNYQIHTNVPLGITPNTRTT